MNPRNCSPCVFRARSWALRNPCIHLSGSLFPSLPACLGAFASLWTVNSNNLWLHEAEVCLTVLLVWQTCEKTAVVSFLHVSPKLQLSCSRSTLPGRAPTALGHGSPHSGLGTGWPGGLPSPSPSGGGAPSRTGEPYLNDLGWYGFLSVLRSVPLLGAIRLSFKRFGNYRHPRNRWKKNPINSCCIQKFIESDSWKYE